MFLSALDADVPEKPDPKEILNKSLGEADDARLVLSKPLILLGTGVKKQNESSDSYPMLQEAIAVLQCLQCL